MKNKSLVTMWIIAVVISISPAFAYSSGQAPKEQQPQEQKQEQPMHFVLDVHDSNVAELDGFGK